MAEHEHGCGYEHEHPHGADGDAGCHCSGSGSELVRFSVTAPDGLLRRFDEQIARRGDVANRSEAVRDLIRASIAKEQMRTPNEHVIGSLTMIYDHHTGDLTRRLDEVHITANKNTVPNDPEKPFVTSGVRVGTPAVTSRGFKEPEMVQIAHWMGQTARDFDTCREQVRSEVDALCRQFPIYQ